MGGDRTGAHPLCPRRRTWGAFPCGGACGV